jgi:hypothetical protein
VRDQLFRVSGPVLSGGCEVYFRHDVTRLKWAGSARFSIDAASCHTAQNRRDLSKNVSDTPSAPSFSPYHSPFRRCAHSPFRLNLERNGGVPRLIEPVAVPAVFELVEDSAGQFGGLYS